MKGRVTKKLTKKELSILTKTLEGELNGFIFKNVYTSDEFNLPLEDRSDEVDQASVAQSNADRLRFRNREALYEKKIKKALKRVADGEYGICEECGCHIGFSRLNARPTAEQCIVCKEESEREELSSLVSKERKSIGKSMEQVFRY